jgi:hypothetical protein
LVLVRGGGAVEAVITVELSRAGNGGGEQFVWHTEKENEAEELLCTAARFEDERDTGSQRQGY